MDLLVSNSDVWVLNDIEPRAGCQKALDALCEEGRFTKEGKRGGEIVYRRAHPHP